MPVVRSYSEWIHRVNTLTDQQIRVKKPLEDLRQFVVQQFENLLSSFRRDKKLVETYQRTVRVDPMEFDVSVFLTLENAIKKHIDRLQQRNLEIAVSTKDVWTVFSKKFQRLEREEQAFLDMKDRVDKEIVQPVSRMRYHLMLYKQMGIQEQLAKPRVKRY